MENCNCKVCNGKSDWLCTDGELYCAEHAPLNFLQKFFGHFCYYVLLIGNTLYYGR